MLASKHHSMNNKNLWNKASGEKKSFTSNDYVRLGLGLSRNVLDSKTLDEIARELNKPNNTMALTDEELDNLKGVISDTQIYSINEDDLVAWYSDNLPKVAQSLYESIKGDLPNKAKQLVARYTLLTKTDKDMIRIKADYACHHMLTTMDELRGGKIDDDVGSIEVGDITYIPITTYKHQFIDHILNTYFSSDCTKEVRIKFYINTEQVDHFCRALWVLTRDHYENII